MEQAKEVNIIPSIAAKNKHYESAHVARFELLLLLYLTFNTFHIYTILHAGSRVKGVLFSLSVMLYSSSSLISLTWIIYVVVVGRYIILARKHVQVRNVLNML